VAATTRIGELQDESGYGAKRFIDLFSASVGLTPKLFGRIRRFQTMIAYLRQGRPIDLAGVAAECGYYDQPHLNREFRLFAGVTPTEYEPVSSDRPNHIAEEKFIQDSSGSRRLD